MGLAGVGRAGSRNGGWVTGEELPRRRRPPRSTAEAAEVRRKRGDAGGSQTQPVVDPGGQSKVKALDPLPHTLRSSSPPIKQQRCS